MTRFEQEISGALGAYWQESAQKDLKKAVADANERAIVEESGAIKWKSNGHYLMDDFCEKLEYAGYSFSREATRKARNAQNAEFIAEYRRNYKGPTREERAEMRAELGAGTTVVNVLTGKKIRV